MTSHWSQRTNRIIVDCDQFLGSKILKGGSDFGKFIVLERPSSNDFWPQVAASQVSGFAVQEVFELVNRIFHGSEIQDGSEGSGLVGLKLVPSLTTFPEYGLTEDLRDFLSISLETPENAAQIDLQRVLRDNLYVRTIPCTTRPPREDETPGRDYNFITIEQFMISEKNGDILESGFYRGHFYGTPRPGSSINSAQITPIKPLTKSADQPSILFNSELDKFNGDFITVRLRKTDEGFGFTIVGGSGKCDDFLQIKKIIPNGPADESGKLREGDVLMYVNDTCVLGHNHSDVVKIFHTIPVLEQVELTVCRPPSADPLDRLFNSAAPSASIYDNSPSFKKVNIVKGSNGFGFTIVDCLGEGQRVKQIFDGQRCEGLCEGDLILRINQQSVQGMEHSQVVNLLKQCRINESTLFELDSRCPAAAPTQGSVDSSQKTQSTEIEQPNSPILFSAAKPPRPSNNQKTLTIKSDQSAKSRPQPLRSTSASQNSNYANQSSIDLRSRSYSSVGVPILPDQLSQTPLPSVVRDTLDFNITLHLPDGPVFDDSGPGFGFRIVGGMEEGTQVSVGHVVAQSVAAADGRLRAGDEIIEIDGYPVVNASHARVVDLILLSRHRGILNLTVRRPRSTFSHQTSTSGGSDRSSGAAAAAANSTNVTLNKGSLHESFGFVILSSLQKCSSVIGRVIENTPADRSGQLNVGDRLLAVNGISINGMAHHHVVNLIKESGTTITLTIGSSHAPPTQYHRELAEYWRHSDLNDQINNNSSSTLPNRRRHQQSSLSSQIEITGGNTLGRPSTTSLKLDFHNRFSENRVLQQPRSGSLDSAHVRSSFLQSSSKQPSLYANGLSAVYDRLPTENEDLSFEVELPRAWNGYGFSIRGGHEYGLPLFVLRIATGGPAQMDGRMMPGDQIMEINGQPTLGMTHVTAISIIREGGTSVRLALFRRRGRAAKESA